MRDYKAAWRIRTRAWAVKLLGSCCARCNKTEELEFDHVIPGSKEFEISAGIRDGYSRARIQVELEKCQLLCDSCHHIKSQECGETGGGWNRIDEHGTEAYCLRMRCSCIPCIQARHDARVRRGEVTRPLDKRYPGRGRYGTVTEHGGGKRGVRGCKCNLCRARWAKTMRDYNQQKKLAGVVLAV